MSAGRPDSAVAAISAAFFLVLLVPSLSPHYGLYSDELCYLACSRRLAFGYVDQPPLFLFVLRLHRALFGDSQLALRILPAALGAGTAFLTGWMAYRLGGGRLAQALATLAVATSGMCLAMFSWLSVNPLEYLLWTAGGWIFLELCAGSDRRLWLALGAVLGLAFLTKHTGVLLIAGLAAGTLLGPLRRDLATRWPWLGALAFVALAAPNLAWQAAHDWPSLAFDRGKGAENIPLSPLDVLVQQIVVQNPATLPLWAGGLVFFLRAPAGLAVRPLGWLFAAILGIAMVGGQSVPYRITGAFPVAFAGGAVLLERLCAARPSRLLSVSIRTVLPCLMVVIGLVAATLCLPILPPQVLARHSLYDGEEWRHEPGPKRLPYLLGNRTHWESFVAAVTAVSDGLAPRERERAIVLLDYFGHAGAIERYGGPTLPPVYSPHPGYYHWGPPERPPEVVIAVGIDEDLLRAHFARVDVADVFRCRWCPPWQDELPLHVAREPTRPFAALWRALGRIGGMDRHRRLVRAEIR